MKQHNVALAKTVYW